MALWCLVTRGLEVCICWCQWAGREEMYVTLLPKILCGKRLPNCLIFGWCNWDFHFQGLSIPIWASLYGIWLDLWYAHPRHTFVQSPITPPTYHFVPALSCIFLTSLDHLASPFAMLKPSHPAQISADSLLFSCTMPDAVFRFCQFWIFYAVESSLLLCSSLFSLNLFIPSKDHLSWCSVFSLNTGRNRIGLIKWLMQAGWWPWTQWTSFAPFICQSPEALQAMLMYCLMLEQYLKLSNQYLSGLDVY